MLLAPAARQSLPVVLRAARRAARAASKMADDNVARCAHLLLKHTGSRNPVSRRTNQRITMTKAEALDELGCFAAAETECLPVLSASQVSGSKHDDSLAHVYDYQSVVKIDEWINDVPISAFA